MRNTIEPTEWVTFDDEVPPEAFMQSIPGLIVRYSAGDVCKEIDNSTGDITLVWPGKTN